MERPRILRLVEIGAVAVIFSGAILGYQHLESESKKPQLLAKGNYMELYLGCEFTNRLLPTREGYKEAYLWIMGTGKYDIQTGKQMDSGEIRVFVENSKLIFNEEYGFVPPVETNLKPNPYKGIYDINATLWDRLPPNPYTRKEKYQPVPIEELSGRAYCPSHILYGILSKIPIIGKLF